MFKDFNACSLEQWSDQREALPTLLISHAHCPYLHQSIEELFLHGKNQAPLLFLYVNAPTVMMGRFQNPLLECNREEFNKGSFHLGRRRSGGGTVYQDYGNLNFCFIHSKDRQGKNFKEENLRFIIQALTPWTEELSINERFDLIFREKKCSGSAYRLTSFKNLHHGTLLIESDLPQLRKAIMPRPEIVDRVKNTKSVSSVRSKTLNLKTAIAQLTVSQAIKSITTFFTQKYPNGELFQIPASFQAQNKGAQLMREFSSTSWIFEKTPPFDWSIPTNTLSPELKKVMKFNLEKDAFFSPLKRNDPVLSDNSHNPIFYHRNPLLPHLAPSFDLDP